MRTCNSCGGETLFQECDACLAKVVKVEKRARGVNPKDLVGLTKPDLSLIPPVAEVYMATAFSDGAAKYGAFNWREKNVMARVYIAAAKRHIAEWADREELDPVSGVHHLGHAMACLAILLDAQEQDNLTDDRPTVGRAGDVIRRLTKKASES